MLFFPSFQEEEETRRLEALKRERQKRIASKNGSKAVQSPMNPNQSNYEKNSKFKGSEIRSNLPLQKLPILNVSTKVIKTTSYVALSLSDLKESEKQEDNSVSARIRRLSEPKHNRVSSVHAKSTGTSKMIKKALAEEPRSKKTLAIIQQDKSNSETLPELKIIAEGTSSEVLQNKPATKPQKVAVGKISLISESPCAEMKPEKNPKLSQINDYPLIEETVMILKNEVAPAHHAQTFERRIDVEIKSPWDTKIESATRDVGYAAIYTSSSPFGRVHSENQTEDNQNDPINSFEVNL